MSARARVVTIASMQARVLVRERRARMLALFTMLLFTITLACGAAQHAGDRRAHRAGVKAARATFTDWVAAYGGDPWRPVYTASENPILLARETPQLAMLSRGVLDRVGRWSLATGFTQRELSGAPAELSPLSALLGGLDLAGLFAMLGALVAVLLGHDALTGERERGTWALHLAAGVEPSELFAGKVLGTVFAVALLVCVPLAATLAAATAIVANSAALKAAASFWLLALGYVGLWATISVAVSARTERSSTALARLIVAWLLATLVWPRAAAGIASTFAPVAHSAEIEARLAAALQEANTRYMDGLKFYQKQHGARPDPVSAAHLKLSYYDDLARRLEPVQDGARREALAQERLFVRLACLSPAFALELAASELAGTGTTGHVAFLADATRFGWTLKRDAEQRIVRGQLRAPSWEDIQALGPPGTGSEFTEESR